MSDRFSSELLRHTKFNSESEHKKRINDPTRAGVSSFEDDFALQLMRNRTNYLHDEKSGDFVVKNELELKRFNSLYKKIVSKLKNLKPDQRDELMRLLKEMEGYDLIKGTQKEHGVAQGGNKYRSKCLYWRICS